jgi:hypothetical protein
MTSRFFAFSFGDGSSFLSGFFASSCSRGINGVIHDEPRGFLVVVRLVLRRAFSVGDGFSSVVDPPAGCSCSRGINGVIHDEPRGCRLVLRRRVIVF